MFSFLRTSFLVVTPTFGEVDVIATEQTFLSKTRGQYFLGDFGLKCLHISVKLGVFLSLIVQWRGGGGRGKGGQSPPPSDNF